MVKKIVEVEKSKDINLRSEEINDLLGTPPRWIIRGGIGVVFVVVLTIIVGSAFFQYPEIITAPVVVSTENPPSMVVARIGGKLSGLLVADGATVSKGDTLAMIQNSASLTDIGILQKRMLVAASAVDRYDTLLLPREEVFLHLGEVQSPYATFTRSVADYRLFLRQDFHHKKMTALQKEQKEYRVYCTRLQSQLRLMERDLKISQNQFRRDSVLFTQQNIAALDYERAEQALLAKRSGLEQSKVSVSNASITLAKLEQEQLELSMTFSEQDAKLKSDLRLAYEQLVTLLSAWEQQYLLKAATSGKMSYIKVWSLSQEVKAGESVFAVVAENPGNPVGRIELPAQGAGKVKEGQSVNIKLDGYPFMEYGLLTGRVRLVSVAPSEGKYTVVVELPKALETSYHKKVNLRGELSGIADISTEEASLLQRLLYPVRYLFRMQS
ncbi:HlyD family secretion protein [Williamwhitmania taraxaci]|uniref:HlyD family secretion protein n=1 Tax=Williamwhitmania taraxaci TaxID=1640674 RepID=A0A1G6PPU4_9BACT|nr:HlyD family secretion protein [Williamwhitmania taraxaci]